MASTYSTNLKIELQATGENSGTWGTITNTNLGTALEQAIVGYGNPNYASDANLTLTYTDTNAAQAARALVLNVTSTGSLSTTRELIVPTIQKQYIVQNNTTGSQSITVKTSGGSGITVPNGRKAHLYVDGTNVIFMDDYVDINGGTIDNVIIGGGTAAAGTFTTVAATTGNITTVNATTVDTTSIEVTNIKAKDGTAAVTVADSTGKVTVSTELAVDNINVSGNAITSTDTNGNIDLTPNGTGEVNITKVDIDGGAIDGTAIGANSASSGAFTTLSATGVTTLQAGTNSAPALTTTGDTNTGIYFPAADTVGFAEGGTGYKVGFRNVPQSGSDKTTSYTLATSDIGEFVGVGSGGSITIPDATFAAGDVVSIFNNTSGAITITCTITTAYIAGTDADKASVSLATRGVATILFLSGTVCVINGNVS
jgi:hypothetical protein